MFQLKQIELVYSCVDSQFPKANQLIKHNFKIIQQS